MSIEADEQFMRTVMKPYAQVREPSDTDAQSQQGVDANMDPLAKNMRTCTLKLEGELTYSPEYHSKFKVHPSIERSQSSPQMNMNNIRFQGKFHGIPEYRASFKSYDHFSKSAPIKSRDHLRVSPMRSNAAVISPTVSSLTEYSDKFKEIDVSTVAKTKLAKQMDNLALKNDLVVNQHHVIPEYIERYQDPKVQKMPDRPKARSPILGLKGSMEYKPEYR